MIIIATGVAIAWSFMRRPSILREDHVGFPAVVRSNSTDMMMAELSPELRAWYHAPDSPQAPMVEFENNQIDLGTVNAGESIPGTLKFRNRGQDSLRILAVRPRCGCTTGEIRVGGNTYKLGDAIPPGAQGSCDVRFSAAGYSGAKDFIVDILTNDWTLQYNDGRPVGLVEIHTKVNIRRSYEFANGHALIDLGEFSYTKGGEGSVILQSVSGHEFAVGAFASAIPLLTMSAEPIDATRSRWKIVAKAGVGAPLGPFNRSVHVPLISSEAGNPKSIDISVSGFVRGSVHVSPATGIHFNVIPRGHAGERKVQFAVVPGSSLHVAGVQIVKEKSRSHRATSHSDPDGIPLGVQADFVACEISGASTGQEVTILVRVTPDAPSGSFTRFLRLTTGIEDGPMDMELPITGFVR